MRLEVWTRSRVALTRRRWRRSRTPAPRRRASPWARRPPRSSRSCAQATQTETARFWSDNPVVQFQAAFRDRVARRGLDAVQTARMFAVLNMSAADALIAAWRGKFDFAFWRPVTAIQLADTDGNPATVADPAWTSLIGTPAYPDYPSGHASVVGATAKGLSRLFGRHDIDLFVSSAAMGVTSPTRHYMSARTLNEDTINARVWLGIHFRKADVDANRLGRAVARFALANYFQPTH